MDLKQEVVVVFNRDLDPRYVVPYIAPIVWMWKSLYYDNICNSYDNEELVAMHATDLNKGNLAYFEGDSWIRNDVNITLYPLYALI